MISMAGFRTDTKGDRDCPWALNRRTTMPTKTKASTTAKKAAAGEDAPAKKTSSAAKKTASAGKGASGKKVNPALMKPLQPSNELAAVVGSKPLPRPEVVSKVWDYIKRNNLQNPANKREIKAYGHLEKFVFWTAKCDFGVSGAF